MDTVYLESDKDVKNKNPITSCVLYNIDSLDEYEENLVKLVIKMQDLLNIRFGKNYDLKNISMGLIYLYNSYNILLDLPHMIHRIQRKGKPCSYLVFGELINQLSSITFLSESIKLINNVDNLMLDSRLAASLKKNNFMEFHWNSIK